MTDETKIEVIEKALLRIGVHRGFPEKRRAMAVTLSRCKHQFSTTIADALYLEASGGRSAQNPSAMVASWLADGSWEQLWEELQESADHLVGLQPKHCEQLNYMPPKTPTPDEEAEDRASWIYCRVTGDRKSIEHVAQEMGISTDEVRRQAIQGCRFRGGDPKTDRRLRCVLDPRFAESERKRLRALMQGRQPKTAPMPTKPKPASPRDGLQELL